jgi:hypothetical protein
MDLISFKAAAALVPQVDGAPIGAQTVRNWSQRGLRVGERIVKLPVVRVGFRWGVRRDDLKQFLCEVSGRPVDLRETACAQG